ncbi:MAG: 6-bladed beta-propeller [Odoribacteraceae bacterium]|nr:6-bladed beta-propeller [Odoribacteraceae bacterium]
MYDIANDVEPAWDIVALETKDECLISSVSKVVYRNNIYYVLDRKINALFLFDSAGKFLSKINKRGRGPDEYSDASAFVVVGKNIWISDGNMRSLICYDENLEMIDRFNTWEIMGADHIEYANETIYMANNWTGWKDEGNIAFGAYDVASKQVTEFVHTPRRGDDVARMRKQGQLSQLGDTCLFYHAFCDTIFQAYGDTCTPAYKVIFSERYEDIPLPIEKILDPDTKHIIRGLEDIDQTRNTVLIGYFESDFFVSALYDKKTGTCQVYRKIINSNLNNLPIYRYNTFFDGDQIISAYDNLEPVVNAFAYGKLNELKNESDKEKIRSALTGLTSYSNPVLIRFKLREDSKL